jgi:formate dehydrogenase subunit delta
VNTLERLVYMANQIARNFEIGGHDPAVLAVADHIDHFWDPRMKSMIFAHLAADGEDLSPIAHDAIVRLRDKGAPPPQTHATESTGAAEGGSDAG